MDTEKLKPLLLIINPVSGKKMILRFIPQIIRIFMDAGYIVTTMITSRRGEATEFAEKYGANYELICCTGGDGTLNETVSGIVRGSINVPVGYIPCGSTNDFAMSRNLSTDILSAAKDIASGRQTRYDVGVFGDHSFTYVAAFGAFSWLSYTTDQNMKNILGHTAYILDAIKDVYKIKPLHVKLTADGRSYEDDYIFGAVCNSTSVAGTIELPKTLVDTCDGKFEVLLIKMPKTILDLDNIIRGVLAQDYSSSLVDFFQAKDIEIENAPGLEWALDGECSDSFEKTKVSIMKSFLNLQG